MVGCLPYMAVTPLGKIPGLVTPKRLLEDMDNYNVVYKVMESCTNEISTRQARDQFCMGGNDIWADLNFGRMGMTS